MKVYKYNGSKLGLINSENFSCSFNNAINETHFFSGNYSTQFTAKLMLYVQELMNTATLNIYIDDIITGSLFLNSMSKKNSFYLGSLSLAEGQQITIETFDGLHENDLLTLRFDYEKIYLGD